MPKKEATEKKVESNAGNLKFWLAVIAAEKGLVAIITAADSSVRRSVANAASRYDVGTSSNSIKCGEK